MDYKISEKVLNDFSEKIANILEVIRKLWLKTEIESMLEKIASELFDVASGLKACAIPIEENLTVNYAEISPLDLNNMQNRLDTIDAFIRGARAATDSEAMERVLKILNNDLFDFEKLLWEVLAGADGDLKTFTKVTAENLKINKSDISPLDSLKMKNRLDAVDAFIKGARKATNDEAVERVLESLNNDLLEFKELFFEALVGVKSAVEGRAA